MQSQYVIVGSCSIERCMPSYGQACEARVLHRLHKAAYAGLNGRDLYQFDEDGICRRFNTPRGINSRIQAGQCKSLYAACMQLGMLCLCCCDGDICR
jgi:hypothetical protein